MWREALNGTVAILGSNTFDRLIRIAGFFSVISTLMFWLKGRDFTVFLKWLVVFFIITNICLVPKRGVQIIDVSNQAAVYQVDNVPVVMGFLSSFATTIGYSTASLFDQDISLPDSLAYSKTGMSFGADLAVSERDAPNYSFPLSDNLVAYMNKCAVPAILINNQYHVHDILEAQDISQVIFQNPSQIASMPYTDNNGNITLVTCFAGAAALQKALNSPALTFQKEVQKWTQRVFGSRSTASAEMENYIQDSTQFFYGVGKSQTDILKKRIMQSAVSRSIGTLAAEDRNTAMAQIIAEQQTAMKTNMQGKVEQHIGARYMPLLHSVLELILVCIFPLVIAVALISHETFGLKTLLTYAGGWFYLQLWPVMFALVNFISVYSLKAHTLGMGGGDALSARYEIAGYYTDMTAVAGYLCLGAIPVLSYIITRGAAAVGSQVAGAISGSAGMASGASASLATDGNWSFNNLSQDNVSANKWNTNVDHREGMTTTQMGNGALTSTTADGSHVLDSSGAVSKLATNINFASNMSDSLTQSARQASTDASSHLQGFNHATDTAYSQMNDLSHSNSRSNTATHGTEGSESLSQSQTASHVMDMAHSYAQRWGVSDKEAFNRLYSAASSDNYHANAGVQASAGVMALGNGATISAGAGVSTGQGYSDTGTTAKGSDRSTDRTSDVSAADRKDFRESMDTLKQSRNYNGDNTAQAQTDGQTNRLESTLRTADSEYSQYTTSQTQANELSQQAQRAQTDSAGFNANMNQEFVNWARERGATDEQLTNVNQQTPLAAEFVRERFGQNMSAGHEQNVQQAMGTPQGQAFQTGSGNLGSNFGDNSGITMPQSHNNDHAAVNRHSAQGNEGEPLLADAAPVRRQASEPASHSGYPSGGSRQNEPVTGSQPQPLSQNTGETQGASATPGQHQAHEPSGQSRFPSEGSRQAQNFDENNARLQSAAQGRNIPAAVPESTPLNVSRPEGMSQQQQEILKQQEMLKNGAEIRQSGFGEQYENNKRANAEPTLKLPSMNDVKEKMEHAKHQTEGGERYAGYRR